MYQKYLEPIIEEFTTGDYYREVYDAKLEYFDKAGIVYEDDLEFEQRMCIFIDWFIFDRDLPTVDLPPIKYFFRNNKHKLSTEELPIYENLCSTIHSIFQLKRFHWNKKGLIVLDLFSNKSYPIFNTDLIGGFTRGDIFEGRIIPLKDQFEFSRGFCFHPAEITPFILKEIKKVRFQDKPRQTKLILQLAAMKLKYLRFPHIDIHQIYQFESRL